MPDLFDAKCGTFQPVATVGKQVMSVAQQEAKLKMIRRLSEGEIRGWMKARKYDERPWFPGEMEALRDRARELRVRL